MRHLDLPRSEYDIDDLVITERTRGDILRHPVRESDTISTIDLENAYTTGVYSKRPIAIVRGRGALLWDEQGREYIDCAAGHGVANIGHGRSEIAVALAAQAQRLITCPEIVYNDVRARF